MALLIDIEPLHECACNDGLEFFYKAGSEPPDNGIWEPHDSPFVRRLIELFTDRGLTRISSLQTELAKWLNYEAHRRGPRQPRPAGMMERWTEGELALAKLYLESVPPEDFTLDDWMMVVDYLFQRYLNHDALVPDAEWLAVRSTLMGRVQANLEAIEAGQADKLLAAMPNTVADAGQQFGLSRQQRAVMEFGRARAAESVVGLSDAARRRLRRIIMDYQESVFLGNRRPHDLQTTLQDTFASMNRDWRRIAVTEAGEIANQGLVASLPAGAKVKRLEQYANACAFCRQIDGMVFDVVAPDAPDKDGWKAIWVGKTNVGRSAAPRKRVGAEFVPREEDELWWPAAGTQHPHCRGRWLEVSDPVPDGDPEFAAWLNDLLRPDNQQHTEEDVS